jgi:hypothetical protein
MNYPVKRYDGAFEIASDVINENFTARNVSIFLFSIAYKNNPHAILKITVGGLRR